MTPKERAVMQQALEALEEIHVGNMTPMAEENWKKAITALREVLAEPQITTPDVCGEVCARAKLCYGCNKDLEEANAKFAEQAEQPQIDSEDVTEAKRLLPIYSRASKFLEIVSGEQPVSQEPVARVDAWPHLDNDRIIVNLIPWDKLPIGTELYAAPHPVSQELPAPERQMTKPKQGKCECVVKQILFSGDREYCKTCGWPIYTFDEHRAKLLEEKN